jgi:hypothetical protein
VHTPPQETLETSRVILLRLPKGGPEVFLGGKERRHALPEFQTPRWQRVAERLSAAVEESCRIKAVSLSSLALYPATGPEQISYQVMEAYDYLTESPDDKQWVPVDTLVENDFSDRNDFHAVMRAITQSILCSEGASPGPFAHLGWFQELEHWVQAVIGLRGFHLTGRFRQLNAYPTFSLIRFETDGPAFWFKAVGDPNRREYPITLAITQLFPRLVPEVVGARQDWNGWLSREVDGLLLNRCSTAGWLAAARSLADLQLEAIGSSAHILELHAHDLRAQALADHVDPFFRVLRKMAEHDGELPSAIPCGQLQFLRVRIEEALSLLDSTGLPNTLGHLDVNPGNIIFPGAHCVFLDWAEAFVGHPFLTFEYLLEHFRRVFGQHHSWEAEMHESYSSQWHSLASQDKIRRAHKVAPLVALFAYAVENVVEEKQLEEPHRVQQLRSLARRMEREAGQLFEEGASCS